MPHASSEISSFGGSIRGTIGNATMRLFGHTIDTASCRFRADAEQIELHDLECGWLGGAVRAVSATQPALTYRFGSGESPDGQPGVLSGEVLADGGEAPGVVYADLDLAQVEKVRAMLPSLAHDRPFAPPQDSGH